MKQELVYICGPYNAAKSTDRDENILQARRVAYFLASIGVPFICPHTNSARMEDIADRDYWLGMYLNILKRCDALITVVGWEKSSGSQAEIELAQANNIPIFHTFAELIKWCHREDQ